MFLVLAPPTVIPFPPGSTKCSPLDSEPYFLAHTIVPFSRLNLVTTILDSVKSMVLLAWIMYAIPLPSVTQPPKSSSASLNEALLPYK